MNTSRVIDAITPLITVLEQMNIRYHIGGSVVSSVYGILRATFDVDIVADIRQEHVKNLVRQLTDTYYIDEDMIRDAIRRRGSFNVIYLDTMFKVDVFIPKLSAFAQEEGLRTQSKTLAEGTRPFYLSSPEDVVLNKLEWYKMGGGVSDRQWNDILGVLKVQGTNIDMAYLRKWAVTLAVSDLLEQASVDAGLTTS